MIEAEPDREPDWVRDDEGYPMYRVYLEGCFTKGKLYWDFEEGKHESNHIIVKVENGDLYWRLPEDREHGDWRHPNWSSDFKLWLEDKVEKMLLGGYIDEAE